MGPNDMNFSYIFSVSFTLSACIISVSSIPINLIDFEMSKINISCGEIYEIKIEENIY